MMPSRKPIAAMIGLAAALAFAPAEAYRNSPLAERLFAIPGVSGVFLGGDFITVTKGEAEWPHIKPAVLGAIMEHFMSGMPVLRSEPARAK